jgi:secondary thiamine-phosphate synthase enzyme
MASKLFVVEDDSPALRVCSDVVRLRTQARFQFVDLTELVAERVRRSRVVHGLVSVQTRHTTAAVVVNENEPRLLEDMRRMLERLAPCDLGYRHNDFHARPDAQPEERANGDAHCRALLLRASECLSVMGGELQLGRWQSVFLVELDGPQPRTVSVTVMGVAGSGASGGRV